MKKNNLLIILLFLSAITLPFLFSDKAGGGISKAENRYLARFPALFTSGMRPASGVRSGLENWIKDNAGGRDLAITINNLVTYRLFHFYPIPTVVEGKDGWLYLLPDYDIPGYVGTDVPNQAHLNWLRDNYSRMTSDFNKRGIQFTVMVWPFKYDLYPEFFPSTLKKVSHETALQLLDRELSNDPHFDFRTPLKALEAAKQDHQVYYKAYDNSHWNQYGAFLGYTELMSQARAHLPGLKVLTESDFNITTVNRVTTTYWGFHAEEEDLQYELKGGYHARSDKSFFDGFPFNSKDPWRSYNYFINPDSSLPRAIIVGDSMIWEFMLPNMAESFSQLVFIHYNDMGSLDTIASIIKPDIIIMAGRGLGVADQLATYTSTPVDYYYAVITADTTPSEVKQGSQYVFDITMKNTGTETWSEADQIRLAILVDGEDHGYRIPLPEGVEVKPGETHTFKLEGFRPPEKDSVSIAYQMVQEGVQYFGQKKDVDITISK